MWINSPRSHALFLGFGTIRSTLSLSCLTLCLQQSFTVDLLLIRCHTFLNSNPIIQEILFRKFGVNRLNSLWVIPSSASLLSSCPAAMTRWISWWRHSFLPQPVLINSNHGGSHLLFHRNLFEDCRSGSEDGPWQRLQQISPYTEEKPSSDQKVIILQ